MKYRLLIKFDYSMISCRPCVCQLLSDMSDMHHNSQWVLMAQLLPAQCLKLKNLSNQKLADKEKETRHTHQCGHGKSVHSR